MRISDWSSDVCSSDLPVAGRDPLQQASPLLAIVELLLLQVLRQEMLDVGAKSAREQEGDEQQDAGEQEHGLHRAAPGAADAAHVVGGRRHERQVEAGDRKSVGEGKRVAGRVVLGGGLILKKKN